MGVRQQAERGRREWLLGAYAGCDSPRLRTLRKG